MSFPLNVVVRAGEQAADSSFFLLNPLPYSFPPCIAAKAANEICFANGRRINAFDERVWLLVKAFCLSKASSFSPLPRNYGENNCVERSFRSSSDLEIYG